MRVEDGSGSDEEVVSTAGDEELVVTIGDDGGPEVSVGRRAFFLDADPGDTANHAGEVEWLASVGVTRGWDMKDGTCQFRGKNTVARQDMAAFMYRLYGYLQ